MKTFRTVLLSYLIAFLILPPALGQAAWAGSSASNQPPRTATPYAALYSGSVPASARASLAVSMTPGPIADSPSKANEPAVQPREIAALERDRSHVELPTSIQSGLKQKSSLSAMKLGRASAFIENRGQFDRRVKFQMKGSGQTLWLTDQGIVFDSVRPKDKTDRKTQSRFPDSRENLAAPRHVERLVFTEDFVDARQSPTVEAGHPLPGLYNYFIGNDPKKWRTDVRGYAEVTYQNVWDGVDLKLYRNGANLEQEFVVNPGGDLSKVRVSFKGIDGLKIANDGSLLIQTAFGNVRETQPRIYQEISGRRLAVDGRFQLTGDSSYTFAVASHNPQYALVLDPTLLYSTFLGGSAGLSGAGGGIIVNEQANAIAVDASGSAYVTGFTNSSDFPTTPGAFQTSSTGGTAFVTKLTPLGDQLVYSTYLGPSPVFVGGTGIALDTAGEAYVVGLGGAGYPTTSAAYQACSSSNGAPSITKLSAAGDSLIYSTCLGNRNASSPALGVALDSQGRAYVVGRANQGGEVPTTSNALIQNFPSTSFHIGFFSVLDPSLSGARSLIYSTYLGGSVADSAAAVAVDSHGMAYVAGSTSSPDFPVTPGAYQTKLNQGATIGNTDAFIAKLKLNASGATSLIYATYLGGSSGDEAQGIAVDEMGNAYVTGDTGNGTIAFPTTPGAVEPTYPGGDLGGFVTKLNAAGNNLIYSTFMGSGVSRAIAADAAGNAYITGHYSGGSGTSFPTPTADAAQPNYGGGRSDGYVTKLDPSGALIYASFLGGISFEDSLGIAIDATGDAYVTGYTASTDFPASPFAYQPKINPGGSAGPADAFVTKLPLGSQFRVFQISPNEAGNAGSVTATVFGSGFNISTSVALSCPNSPPAVGHDTTVDEAGRIVTTTFSLTGIQPGRCDVSVTNIDGMSVSLPNSFKVDQGGSPDVWVDVVGRDTIRPGSPQVYYLAYGNKGNIDSGPVVLEMHVPNLSVLSTVAPDPSFLLGSFQIGPDSVATYLAPNIPPGGAGAFPVTLTTSTNPTLRHATFTITTFYQVAAALATTVAISLRASSSSTSSTGASSPPPTWVDVISPTDIYGGCPALGLLQGSASIATRLGRLTKILSPLHSRRTRNMCWRN